MRFLVTIARSYPWQTLVTLAVLIIAGIVEGLSLSALLPLLNMANVQFSEGGMGSEGVLEGNHAGPGKVVLGLLSGIGLSPSIGVLLSAIVCGILLKNVLLLWGKNKWDLR